MKPSIRQFRPRCSQCGGKIGRVRGLDATLCSIRCEKASTMPPLAERRTPSEIVASICVGTGLKPSDLMTPSRVARVVEVRSRAMRALRKETLLSLPQIGRLFNKDHTTVVHALSKEDQPLAPMPPVKPTPAPKVTISGIPHFLPPIKISLSLRKPEVDPVEAEAELRRKRCRLATDDLRSRLGSVDYSSQNVRPERRKLAPPTWF